MPPVVSVTHGGSLFLIDPGRPVPNCDATEPSTSCQGRPDTRRAFPHSGPELQLPAFRARCARDQVPSRQGARRPLKMTAKTIAESPHCNS